MLFKKMDGFSINNNMVKVNIDIKKLWKLFILLWFIVYSDVDSVEPVTEYVVDSVIGSEYSKDNRSVSSGCVNNTLTIFK